MTDKRVDMAKLDDSIASRLKRVRTALELRSAEMAEHLGMGNSKYSNLETGKQIPDADTLAQIDAVLAANGVPAGWVGGQPTLTIQAESVSIDTVQTVEIWEYSDDALLSELSRRLFERGSAEVAAPMLLADAREIEAVASSPDIAAYDPEPPIASEATTTVPEVALPVEPTLAVPDVVSIPSHPVAAPAVDVPLPMPIVVGDVVAPIPGPAPIATTSSDPLLAVIGQPAAPAATGALGFEQPVAVEPAERPLVEVLLEQFGVDSTPPAAFVPAAPAQV